MRKAQITRRQAEAMTDDLGPEPTELQENKALVYERHDIYELLDDIDNELAAETNLDFEYRIPTRPEPISTPWMRRSEEERDHIRRRRRMRALPSITRDELPDAHGRAA